MFIANEEWEHGSIYEPNLIYHDGKWKMWYVSGSNEEDYLVHGYAESDDGSAGWSKHKVFAPPEMKMFDFCVRQRGELFDAIFARVWLRAGTPGQVIGPFSSFGHTRKSTRPRASDRLMAATPHNRKACQFQDPIGVLTSNEDAAEME